MLLRLLLGPAKIYYKIYKTRDECPTICGKHRTYSDYPEQMRVAYPFRVILGYCAAKCLGCVFEEMLKSPETRVLYKKYD